MNRNITFGEERKRAKNNVMFRCSVFVPKIAEDLLVIRADFLSISLLGIFLGKKKQKNTRLSDLFFV